MLRRQNAWLFNMKPFKRLAGQLKEDHLQIYVYTRILVDEAILLINNFSAEAVEFCIPDLTQYKSAELLISNEPVEEGLTKSIL